MSDTDVSRLMVVDLDIKGFSNSVKDEEATEELASSKGADAKAVRVNKSLINPEYVKELSKEIRAARGTHESLTLPYLVKGLRLLTTDVQPEYIRQMTAHKDAVRQLATKLGKDWSDALANAPGYLGQMFNANNYPTADDVEKSIRFEMNFQPVPDAESVRRWVAHLSHEQVSKLEDEHRANLQKAFDAAHNDVMERVIRRARTFLARVDAKNADSSSPIHETALESFRDILQLVQKGLAVKKDPAFDALVADLTAAIDGATLEDIKTVESDRKQRGDAVRKALNKFEGVL